MKKFYVLMLFAYCMQYVSAQTWNITGNSGTTNANFLGTTDNKDLIFKAKNKERGRIDASGFWRFGSATNYAKIDSAGNLIFIGNGAYLVPGSKYVFRDSSNPNRGLFYNSSVPQYEFRSSSANPVFYVNADNGNGVFTGTLKIGAYTLPSIDGTDGQVLTTNGAGVITWKTIAASGANTSLSNLTATTAVNRSLLPASDDYLNIGSATKQWKNIYADGSIYLHGEQFISTGTNTLNTAIGLLALRANTEGYRNTATGYNALYSNTKGHDNAANGYRALADNTSGSGNTAYGSFALSTNQSGDDNTAVGEALENNLYGDANTGIGSAALEYNTNGSHNIAVGTFALYHNEKGNENTAIGNEALSQTKTISNIVAVGDKALFNLNDGSPGHCMAIGSEAGYNNTTGGNNTYVGYHAGNTVTTGSSNTLIGYGADVKTGGLANATALGSSAIVGANDRVRIGNTSVSSIGGQVAWSVFSDERVKNNIKENVPGLKFINLLKPITYNYDIDKEQNIIGVKTEENWSSKYDVTKIQFTGFSAQQVEKAAKQIGYDFSGVDAPKNDKDLYALRYSDFVVPLVKAVQELSKMNDDKSAAIDSLKKENDILSARLDKIESMLNLSSQDLNKASFVDLSNTISLEQNIPNPFTNTTTIAYSLPQKFYSAQIIISDKNGKQLKQLNLSAAGKGTIHIDASTLASGAYNYSLIVDGRLIATKQMVLSK